jgi:[ribosomal protein S5]-alanine N-acetyltransferase
MELDLGVCTVRSWRADDATSLVRHANNRKIWRNLRDRFPYPYTPADADAFLRSVIGLTPETSFAIAVDGAATGGIGLTLAEDIHRRTAELGYWLGEEYWGRGIASAAVRAVTEYAFSHHDLVRIWAGVFAWNPGSMRVLEKVGYLREATLRKSAFKDGEIVDEVIFAAVRDY